MHKKNNDIHKKISDSSDFVIKDVLNTKFNGVGNKMLDSTSLVTNTVLNTKIGEIENKIPSFTKYFTTWEFNKLTAEKFGARLKQVDWGTTLILILK